MNMLSNLYEKAEFKGTQGSMMRGGVPAFEGIGGGLVVPLGLNVNTRYSSNQIQYEGGSASSLYHDVVPDNLFDEMFDCISKTPKKSNKTKRQR
jgi:hypothetical protein